MLKNFRKHQTFFWGQFIAALGVCAVFVTILVATPMFQGHLRDYPYYFYESVVIIALVWAIFRLYSATSHVEFRVRGTKIDVAIVFGDIFKQKGSIVVPVSPYFRHRLKGSHKGQVNPRSVHGQVIELFSNASDFCDALASALSKYESISGGNLTEETAAYPIGTVASIPRSSAVAGQSGFFHLLAITEENEKTGKTSTNLPMLVSSLSKALEQITAMEEAQNLVVPLIGDQHGRIALEEENLLDIIVAVVSEFFRRAGGSHTVTIVLHKNLQGKLKLYNVQREWA